MLIVVLHFNLTFYHQLPPTLIHHHLAHQNCNETQPAYGNDHGDNFSLLPPDDDKNQSSSSSSEYSSSSESPDLETLSDRNCRNNNSFHGRPRPAGRGRGRGGSGRQRNQNQNQYTDVGRICKRQFRFTEMPGVNVLPEDCTSPMSILKTFLTDELVQEIVDSTNKYADILKQDPQIQAKMDAYHRSLFNLWKPTNIDEMWIYITITLFMGIVNKPRYSMYWTKRHMFSTPIFTRLMRRDRFEQLRCVK